MPQVIKSGESVAKTKKSDGNSTEGQHNTKLMGAIAACAIAVLFVSYIGYATFFKRTAVGIAPTDKTAPPPGYPDQFPYNMKRWQDGKMIGGGFPLPPKLGGQPPNAVPSAGQPGR